MCPPDTTLLKQQRPSSAATLSDLTTTAQQLSRNGSEDTLMDTAPSGTPKMVATAAAVTTGIPLAVLTAAPPPWHSMALIGTVVAIFVQWLPSWDQIDQGATLATFAQAEPWVGGTLRLGLYRLAIALSIWATTLHLLTGPGWTIITNWKPSSKLKGNVAIRLSGIKTMFPFTSWSWNLLGLSYSLNAMIALCVATGHADWIVQSQHNWVLRLALIVWEMAAPCAILVSTVIRYAIWEMALKGKGGTANLKSFRNVMMHNANSIFVVMEVALLGGLPVRFTEVSLAPLFGVCYVIFTWNMMHRWADKEHGPQNIYFFFDTTMGKVTTISLLALLCALLIFYALFASARIGLDRLAWAFQEPEAEEETFKSSVMKLPCHACFLILLSSTVCRFRD